MAQTIRNGNKYRNCSRRQRSKDIALSEDHPNPPPKRIALQENKKCETRMKDDHISLMTMLRSISDAICEGIPEATVLKDLSMLWN